VLDVRNLTVTFDGQTQDLPVVNGISFSVAAGEVVGIVGESGSGKSLTALAVAGLLPVGAGVSGEIVFQGKKIRPGRAEDFHLIRGKEIGMVFQEPGACLNPLMTVGKLISETLCLHQKLSATHARKKTLELFDSLGILPAALRAEQYPHQLSGGLKQRVMLASAICCRPPLLLADEPTTALDVSVQAQILGLLRSYVAEAGATMLLISHDLGVIAQLADRVLVMCEGQIVESASSSDLFAQPRHPYTQLLLASVPRLDSPLYIPEILTENSLRDAMCVFASRCIARGPACVKPPKLLADKTGKRQVRCHYASGEYDE
jgi:oligopeptide/dipeptide ABC transporter ATP-binding protein